MNEKSDNTALYSRYTTTATQVNGNINDWLRSSSDYFKSHYAHLLPDHRKARILEIGCGHGRFVKAMMGLGYSDVTGVDLSEEQVAFAKLQLGLNNIVQADAIEWLAENQGTFDCILVIDVFEHLDNSQLLALTGAIYKSLASGGRLIAQIPSGTSPINPIIFGDLTHLRAFTPRSMQQLFLNSGFEEFQFSEIAPGTYNMSNFIRYLAWCALKPIIKAFSLLVHGGAARGSIYTSNFIATASKNLMHCKVDNNAKL